MEQINRWSWTKHFYKKILTIATFLLAPAANMLGTRQFFIGRMKWRHAVILEPISETDSIKILLPA